MSEEKEEKFDGQKVADTVEVVTELATGVIEDLTTKSETTEEALAESAQNADDAIAEAEALKEKGH